jgi:hypothetical protein
MAAMSDITRLLVILAALAAASLSFTGCDGTVSAHGQVFRTAGRDASARSRIVVDGHPPSTQGLEPMAGVKVTLYHRPEYAHRNDDTARLWRETDVSKEDGSFEMGGACAPGEFDMALGASKEGCAPVLQTFRHSSRNFDHTVTVILVCSDETQTTEAASPQKSQRRSRS